MLRMSLAAGYLFTHPLGTPESLKKATETPRKE
jgi:hypothetical protein